MPTFTATILHHSISRAPVIDAGETLRAAKQAASRRFGDGFLEHEIIVRDASGETVASRRIGERRWREWA